MNDAAKELGVSRRTITRWVGANKIRAYTRLGYRERFVDMDEIRRAMQPRPVEPKEGE